MKPHFAIEFRGCAGGKHGMSDEDIKTVRERFFKAYPHLKALAQHLKALAQHLKALAQHLKEKK